MARTINSPGVQITETDLSLTQQFGGGTSVFVAGFAPQGPTDEVLLISTVSELEQVYGAPKTEAERYFYHSSKEILNSNANLLTTRLPYGPDTGEGFGQSYGALLYPVISTDSGFEIGAPVSKSLTIPEYEAITQGNFTWSEIDQGTLVSQTTGIVLSSVTAFPDTSAAILASIESLIDPTPEAGAFIQNIEYTDDGNVTFTFQVTAVTSQGYNTSVASYENNILNAGIVVLNTAQTTINEKFEGYYVAIADNTGFGANTNFDAVSRFYSLTGDNQLGEVSTNRLGFTLSATREQLGTNSISETIEFIPTFNFNNEYYKDSVIVSIFKVRNSIYEPQTLTYSLIEAHAGSLDKNKLASANNAGTPKTYFIQDVVNNGSSNINIFVNPKISEEINWTSQSENVPAVSVTTTAAAKAVYPAGVYLPTYQAASNKEVGSVGLKLQRALTHVEAPDTVLIDIVVDAGLSTINALAQGGKYDEKTKVEDADLTDTTSDISQGWKSIFNIFNTFVEDTRKDCVFISDPLRPIFVRGENTKTLSLRSKTFSQHIYQPLSTQYETINTNYCASYCNWLKTYDPFSDKGFWVPPSGFVAAVYARSEAATQPWIAPAGFSRGTLRNLTDIAFNPNQKQRDFLYTISQNPIALFSGDGYVVFGQKTLQNKPSAFDRVNVRRLFLALERAVQRTVKYFVFEPNTDFTRTRLRSTISPIFDLAKNTQGLYDYLIVCDERNNTPDVIDRNELVVDIYIKPVRAAEFILVNFIATRTSQNFQELI